jgi:branched-chain amino acid transport system substrate-binding protein
MKKFILLLMVCLLALSGTVVSASSTQQDDDPIRIGLLTDLTGALRIYGYELQYGFELGLMYAAGIDPADYDTREDALAAITLDGRPVEILIRDNAGDPAVAAEQARALIEREGVEILVGAPSSGVTLALQQVALDYEVMLFVAPGASPAITGDNFNPNTVRVCRNTFQDFLAFVPYATSEIGTNFVQLAADYDFGRSSADAGEAVFGAAGINFVRDTIYAPLETNDFTQYLQAVLDSGADVLLPIWAGDTSVALFQQIDELGVNDAMAIVAAFNSNDIVAFSDPSTIGNVSWIVYHYTFPQNEINDWMVDRHIQFYPNPDTGAVDYPDLFTECAFASAQAVYYALEETGGDTLPEAVIPVIEGMAFDGPKGTYYIRPSDHQALMAMYVAQLQNLDDEAYAYYDLLADISPALIIPPCLLTGDYAERCTAEADIAFYEAVAESEGVGTE